MVDLKRLIESDEMPDNFDEFKEPLGKYFTLIEEGINLSSDSSKESLAAFLMQTAHKIEKKGDLYEAAICFAMAGILGQSEAYNSIIHLIQKHKKTGDSPYSDKLNEINIELCHQQLLKRKSSNTLQSNQSEIARLLASNVSSIAGHKLTTHVVNDKQENTLQIKLLSQRLIDTYKEYLESNNLLNQNDVLNVEETEQIKNIRDRKEQFLLGILNCQPTEIANLMQLIIAKQNINPEFIPGIKPSVFVQDKYADPDKASSKEKYLWKKMVAMLRSANRDKILKVNEKDRLKDKEKFTQQFDALAREAQRVVIVNGKFMQVNGDDKLKIFDSRNNISHEKPGFAAFTININGEISAFNHLGMIDKIAHSSMNAGAPIFSAGEMCITNGSLTSLTLHSGHYKPGLLSLYETLRYLASLKVDLSNTNVYLYELPPTQLNLPSVPLPFVVNGIQTTVYSCKASDILDKILQCSPATMLLMQLRQQLKIVAKDMPALKEEINKIQSSLDQIDTNIPNSYSLIKAKKNELLDMLKTYAADNINNQLAQLYRMGKDLSKVQDNIIHTALKNIKIAKRYDYVIGVFYDINKEFAEIRKANAIQVDVAQANLAETLKRAKEVLLSDSSDIESKQKIKLEDVDDFMLILKQSSYNNDLSLMQKIHDLYKNKFELAKILLADDHSSNDSKSLLCFEKVSLAIQEINCEIKESLVWKAQAMQEILAQFLPRHNGAIGAGLQQKMPDFQRIQKDIIKLIDDLHKTSVITLSAPYDQFLKMNQKYEHIRKQIDQIVADIPEIHKRTMIEKQILQGEQRSAKLLLKR
jgi:hypothetical protein